MARDNNSDANIMTYDLFRAAMKAGEYSRLYLFCGEEVFLQEFCVNELKKQLIDPSFEDFNYKCYIETPDFESVSSFAASLPLMSQKKLIIFNNCGLFSNQLAEKARWSEMFSTLPDYVVMVIRETGAFSKGKKGSAGKGGDVKAAVTGAAQIVSFDYLPEARLRPWLMKAAAGKGKSLSAQNASYIISSVGRSMTTLRAEIEKIAAKSESFEISRADIDSVIIKPLTETVFKLIDALCAGRRDLCFASVSALYAMNEEPAAILSVIASQMLVLYKAKLLLMGKMNTFEVKKALGGGFKADKAVSNAAKVSLLYLEKLIRFLKESDLGIKSGEKDGWTQLDLLAAI